MIHAHFGVKSQTDPLTMDHRSELTELERRLLDSYQQGLPLSPTPYADMAAALDVSEADVLAALQRLQGLGVISRVGPVFRTHAIGASTLAAMAVPEERLDEVAAIVNSFAAVNHNYEREHRFNLWFVATAASDAGTGRGPGEDRAIDQYQDHALADAGGLPHRSGIQSAMDMKTHQQVSVAARHASRSARSIWP